MHTLEELASYTSRVSPAQRRKRWLADGLPEQPGVYLFKDGDGRVLYVGTSVNIRTRVRSYFTASEQRTRMAEMVRLAESVTPIVCATTLEAEVRELRLIAEHKPRYNRRSKTPERATWVKLTVEAFPRLSIVREVRGDGARYIGPFGSRGSAEAAVAAVHEVIPLRQCVQRLSPTRPVGSCVLADMGRCGAPCTGAQSVQEYAAVVQDAVHALAGDSRDVVTALRTRMGVAGRPGAVRGRRHPARPHARAGARHGPGPADRAAGREPARSSPPARPPPAGWEVIVVRHGRLAASTVSPRGADPMPYVDAVRTSAEVVLPAPWPSPAAIPEETEKILRWLESPGVRIVDLDGEWTCPVGGAGGARAELEPQVVARHAVAGFVAASSTSARHRRRIPRPVRRRYSGLVISAIVLINAEVDRIPEVAQAIAELEGVSEVYSVAGDADLIAMIRVREHEQLNDVIADRLNKVEGVTGTNTHIAFRTYSTHDLEAAFSLGLDGD